MLGTESSWNGWASAPGDFKPKGGQMGLLHKMAAVVPEGRHLLIKPHFLIVQAKLVFIVEGSPKGMDMERGNWGHYCNSHYNRILCSPPVCLLETCLTCDYPVLIIAPGWRFTILWNTPLISELDGRGVRVLPSQCSPSSFLEKILSSPTYPFITLIIISAGLCLTYLCIPVSQVQCLTHRLHVCCPWTWHQRFSFRKVAGLKCLSR